MNPEVYDISQLPQDTLGMIEADSFWCLQHLLEGIQVRLPRGASVYGTRWATVVVGTSLLACMVPIGATVVVGTSLLACMAPTGGYSSGWNLPASVYGTHWGQREWWNPPA